MRLRSHPLSAGPTLLATLFATVATVTTISASSLVVPDDRLTIQEAVNALVDTVFVRNGNYAETPLLFAQVALLAMPGDPAFKYPVLAGLQLSSSPQVYPLFLVRGLQVSGPVTIQNDDYQAYIQLEACRLLAGVSDVSAFPATVGITLCNCEIAKDAFLKADGQCVVDSCVFNGGQLIVGEDNCELAVTHSVFRGSGHAVGISTIGQGTDVYSATITDNVVENYSAGILISAIVFAHIEGNVVRDIGASGIFARSDDVRVIQNRVERCGGIYGINAQSNADLWFVNNVVAQCQQSGALALVTTNATIDGNVVWGSAVEGLHINANPLSGLLQVKNNTSCLNGRSGFLTECLVDPGGRYEFTGNVGFGNARYGVNWGVPDVSVFGCNNWFGNGLGAVSGLPLSGDDFVTDPLFCSPANGDFRLFAASPLVDLAGCGRVGALGVGCDITETLVRQFAASWVAEGIRVVWELSDPSVAALVSLERADIDAEGPWTAIPTEVGTDGAAVIELDRSAITERTYWYRLVASLPGSVRIIGSPISVAPKNNSSFRLAFVGPSPSRGPVQIEFELREPAAIELSIFDLQGRVVATPARGIWSAGKHAVQWPVSGDIARSSAGLYLVRFQYPGGEDRRRIIRTP